MSYRPNNYSLSSLIFFLRASNVKFLKPFNIEHNVKRFYPEVPKRFYKNVTVAGTSNNYEVNLDHKKLKTPLGHILQVPSYPLALAIAHEWNSVDVKILSSWMHLTSLANSVIDNPLDESKLDIVNGTLDFLETDTVLIREQEESNFRILQDEKWTPVVDWFNDRFNVQLQPSSDLINFTITPQIKDIVRKYLLSQNTWTVTGIARGATSLKSLVLAIAGFERRISVQEAVSLSLLEMEFQTKYWGSVDWCHGAEWENTMASFSASLLFAHHSTIDYKKVEKTSS